MNEESFQASLDACSSEQERQALITETLNGLYSEAADKYREVNGAVIDANMAQDNLNAAMAGIGAAVEPFVTAGKILISEVLVSLTPMLTNLASLVIPMVTGAISTVSGWVSDLSGRLSNSGFTFQNVMTFIQSFFQHAAAFCQNGLLHGFRVFAVAADGQKCHAVDGLKAAAEGGVDEALLVELLYYLERLCHAHFILFTIACYILLRTYRSRSAMGSYFLAFALVGSQCLMAPSLLLTLPWLVLCGVFMESLHVRTFLAALWGLLCPFWIVCGVLFLTDRVGDIATYFGHILLACLMLWLPLSSGCNYCGCFFWLCLVVS